MNRRQPFMAALLLTLMAVSLFASNGTQIGTVGARSTAMGSAFRGLADDWSAVYFNPAGLTQLQSKWTIGFSTGFIAPRGSYTANSYPMEMMPSGLMNLTETDAKDRNFVVPAMSIFYKASEKLTLGLGVYAPFGLGTEWDLLENNDLYGNPNAMKKKYENYSDHQVITIQPTVAYQVSERLSVGLGVNFYWGKMVLDLTKLAINPAMPAIAANPTLAGLLMPMINQPFHTRMVVENNLDGDGTTWGFNAGLKYDLTEKLSLGVSARVAGDLALSGSMKTAYYLPYNADVVNTVTAMIQGGQISQADGMALIGAFSGPAADQHMEENVEADLPLPYTVGFGVAYKASEQLTLVADASLSNWAAWETIDVTGESGATTSLKQNWNDTWEYNVGFEYKPNTQLAIRGGFYTVNTPVSDATMSPTILDPYRRNVFTGGLGYQMGKVALSLAGEWVTFKDATVEEYDFDMNTGVSENYAGLYKFTAYVITLGAQIELN